MAIENTSFEYMSIYFISLIITSLIGIIIIEFFDKRLEKLITPICNKISIRRKKVLKRESLEKVK